MGTMCMRGHMRSEDGVSQMRMDEGGVCIADTHISSNNLEYTDRFRYRFPFPPGLTDQVGVMVQTV